MALIGCLIGRATKSIDFGFKLWQKKKIAMSRWNVKTSTLIILSCLIAIMLLIVVLPDVDLDDVAFHQGTAPLVVHARGTTALSAVVIATLLQLPGLALISALLLEFKGPAATLDPNFRPILLCAIRR